MTNNTIFEMHVKRMLSYGGLGTISQYTISSFYPGLVKKYPGDSHLNPSFFDLLFRCPWLSYMFCKNGVFSPKFLATHKEQMELTISKCPYNSFYYSCKVLGKRFPLGEPAISQEKLVRDTYVGFLKNPTPWL